MENLGRYIPPQQKTIAVILCSPTNNCNVKGPHRSIRTRVDDKYASAFTLTTT